MESRWCAEENCEEIWWIAWRSQQAVDETQKKFVACPTAGTSENFPLSARTTDKNTAATKYFGWLRIVVRHHQNYTRINKSLINTKRLRSGCGQCLYLHSFRRMSHSIDVIGLPSLHCVLLLSSFREDNTVKPIEDPLLFELSGRIALFSRLVKYLF